MRLFLTGSLKYNTPQPDPLLSLGGYLSSSPLSNNTLNNLFGAISQSTLQAPKKEYRAVILRNETGTALTNIDLFYENFSNQPLVTLRMALVTLAADGCGGFEMESINGINSSPLSATFKNNLGENNALSIPSLPINGLIGLWIERSFNVTAIKSALSCETLLANYDIVDVNQVSTIQTVADVADSLNETYFFLDTTNDHYYVWLDTGAGDDPLILGREGIRVSVTTNDSASNVASKIAAQLILLVDSRGDVITTVDSSTITVTQQLPGSLPSPTAQTSGFTTAIITQGTNGGAELIEDIGLSFSW